MNQCLPDWNFEADLPAFTQKKPTGQDPELVELLWRNGQVVLQSQTQRKPCPNSNDRRQTNKHDEKTLRGSATYWNPSNLIPDEDTVSWIQYPLEDSFEKEFCSNFFSEMPSSDILEADKVIRQSQAEHCLKIGASVATPTVTNLQQPDFSGNPMPPPKFQFTNSRLQNKGEGVITSFANFSQFTAPIKGDSGSFIQNTGGKVSGNLTQREGKEFPAMTVGSSYCGSNQVLNDLDISRASSIGIGTTATGLSAGPLKHDAGKVSLSETRKTETIEPTLTSSSGGSGTSSGRTCKQSTGVSCHKRKSRDAEESEHQSEAAELESAGGSKPTRRSGSARRSRAAEVHNLSERRRRDRINEKMRALQELIPHCNKTDKASMLDEAIEYLKSLQLQLQAFQLMWMGNGMAPMLFPGVQHYMSRMGMGMGPPALSSFQNAMHLPRVPLVDQSMSMAATQNQAVMCQNPVLNPFNYQNQIQSPAFSEQFARYMGFHHMQNGSQATNGFGFGSQPQCQTMAPPASSSGPFFPGSTTDKVPPSSGTG